MTNNKPPAWLGKTGKAKYRDLATKLSAVGVLTVLDCDVLGLYCQAWEEFRAAQTIIDVEGLFIVSDKNVKYQHPAVGIRNSSIKRIQHFGALLGLDPSNRTRVKTMAPAAPSDFKRFLNRTNRPLPKRMR